MFEIRDDFGHVLATRPDFESAERLLEELCEEATRQAAASGEGTREMTLSWTIVNTITGRTAARMELSPDDSGQPYEPISRIAPRQENQ